MAYLIFIANEAEIDRRELTNEPVTIGRAPDCDVSIHDIVLSRPPCGIVSEMLSRSWDSIYEQNARPVKWQRAMPTPLVSAKAQAAARSKNRVSFSLQVPDERAPSPPPIAERAPYPSRGGKRAPRPF